MKDIIWLKSLFWNLYYYTRNLFVCLNLCTIGHWLRYRLETGMIGTSIIWRETIDRKFSWKEASGQVTGNKLRNFYIKCHRSLNGYSFLLKIFLKINMRIWIFQTIIQKFLLFSTFFLKKPYFFYWNQALCHKFNCVGMS